MVNPIKGYDGLRPSEVGRRGQLFRTDLMACKLLAVLGVVGHRPSEDHEAALQHRKSAVHPLGVICGRLGLLPMLPLIGVSGQELLHEVIVLV